MAEENPFGGFSFKKKAEPTPYAPSAQDPFGGFSFAKPAAPAGGTTTPPPSNFPPRPAGEAGLVPPAPSPYADYSGRLKAAGTGAANTLVNYGYQFPDVVQMAKDVGSWGYGKLFGEEKPQQAAPTVQAGDVTPLPETSAQAAESRRKAAEQNRAAFMMENYPEVVGMGAGLGVPLTGFQTSAEAKKAISPYLYEPKTPAEENIARDVQAGGTWAALSPKSVVGTPFRAVAGAGLEQATRGAESMGLGKVAPFIPIVGMLAGETAAGTLATLGDSDRRVLDAMKRAYQEDVRTGNIDPSKLDPNTPITDIPFNKPSKSALRQLAKQQSQIATDTRDFTEFNRLAQTDELRQNLVKNISSDIEDITGISSNRALEAQEAINNQFKANKDRLYAEARASEPAQAVPRQIFGAYADAPIVKQAEQMVQEAIANNPNNPRFANIRVPTDSAPGNYDYWETVYRQLRDTNFFKNSNIPATQMNIDSAGDAAKNLKAAIDKHMTVSQFEEAAKVVDPAKAEKFVADKYGQDMVDYLKQQGGDKGVIDWAEQAVNVHNSENPNNLIDITSAVAGPRKPIPGTERSLSAEARSTAQEHFNADDIINVGEKFILETPKLGSEAEASERMFASLNPDERAAATYGALNQFNKILTDNPQRGLSWAADNFENNPTFNRKMQLLLGKSLPDGSVDLSDYDALRAKIMAADIKQNIPRWDIDIKNPSLTWRQKHPNLFAAATAGLASGATFASEYLRDLMISSNLMSTAGLAGTGALTAFGLSAKAVSDAAVKRAANDIILKMSTGNVRDLEALSKMTRTNPLYGAVYRGMKVALANEQNATPEENTRMGRATGGSVKRSALSEAQKLIQLADKMKKSESDKTSSLLNLDDTTVAKALAVANKHL